MALKQSHVNQLHKIIASAEKLITEIEREIQSQGEARESRGGRGKTGKTGGGRGGKAAAKSGRGKGASSKSGGRKSGGGRKSAGSEKSAARSNNGRRNRTQTAEFRQSILKELEGGTPVADLAAKHGVTPAYVYQIKSRSES